MSTQRYFRSWTVFLVLVLIQGISADNFDFHQTIPAEDGEACPGGKLQYMCTAVYELFWQIDGSSPVTFNQDMEVNSTKAIDDFSLVLMKKTTTDAGIKLFTTATTDMITSNRDGQQVVCFSDTSLDILYIDVADQPADCSKSSVVPECHATINAMGDTDFSITLPNSTNLSCVEGYQIQFNGESENVSLSAPSASFTISEEQGQSVQNEIMEIYTLDYENRTGLVPCTFNISANISCSPVGSSSLTSATPLWTNLIPFASMTAAPPGLDDQAVGIAVVVAVLLGAFCISICIAVCCVYHTRKKVKFEAITYSSRPAEGFSNPTFSTPSVASTIASTSTPAALPATQCKEHTMESEEQTPLLGKQMPVPKDHVNLPELGNSGAEPDKQIKHGKQLHAQEDENHEPETKAEVAEVHLQHELDKGEKREDELKEEVVHLKHELDMREKREKALKKELAQLHEENSAMKEKLNAKEQELNTVNQELRETERKLMSLTQERNEEFDKLRNEVEKLREEMEQVRSEKIHLMEELDLIEKREKALKKEVEEMKKQLEATSEKIKVASKDAADAKKKTEHFEEEMKKQLEATSERIKVANKDAADAKQKTEYLEERLAALEQTRTSGMHSTAQKVEDNSNPDYDSGLPSEPPTDLEIPRGPEPDCIPCAECQEPVEEKAGYSSGKEGQPEMEETSAATAASATHSQCVITSHHQHVTTVKYHDQGSEMVFGRFSSNQNNKASKEENVGVPENISVPVQATTPEGTAVYPAAALVVPTFKSSSSDHSKSHSSLQDIDHFMDYESPAKKESHSGQSSATESEKLITSGVGKTSPPSTPRSETDC